MDRSVQHYLIFVFNDTATTEIYTLSLHDALPICEVLVPDEPDGLVGRAGRPGPQRPEGPLLTGMADEVEQALLLRLLQDRKSTRLNSSHANISYAVFCLKKNTISTYITFIASYAA